MSGSQWSLRSFVTLILIVTTLTTLFIVGNLILLIRLPMIEKNSLATVRQDVKELAGRMELLLGGLEARLDLVRAAIARLPADQHRSFLQETMADVPVFKAIYLVSRQGKILAVGASEELSRHQQEIHGVDLSANALFQAVVSTNQRCWSDSYLSFMSGSITVGLGLPAGPEHLLIAEVPPAYLLTAALVVFGERTSPLWIIDRRGEIVTSTGGASASGTVNMLGEPLLQAALRHEPLPETIRFKGKRYYAGLAFSQELNWYFIATAPSGLANPAIRITLLFVSLAFLIAILIGAMLTPFWARQLLTPIGRIIGQARQVAEGGSATDWPRGRINEFNDLASHLETMATAIREREKRFYTIFNTSPTPMLVSDTDPDLTMADVNQAWCTLFGRDRDTVRGQSGVEVAFWQSHADWNALVERAKHGPLQEEIWLYHSGGYPLLCRMSTSQIELAGKAMIIWAFEDITEIRSMQQALQQLNAELEERIAQRTEALSASNRELSQTLNNLQITQRELVRSEKMAALGNLVAGVAHELNTPIGNGLISITTLADQARAFQRGMKDGLRRSELEALLANIDQATDIATRNLHRAAELLINFKQVAVDQTSYQRRSFALHELINEIVTTMRPSLKRTPFIIQVQAPERLTMDSYPGPLGQVLSNLINNAVLHGFDGRSYGTIHIDADQDEPGHVILRVKDDGNGISPTIIDRIFDPFVTSRMGRGGTGLGLHIAYNIVSTLLGGTLGVESQENEGTVFTLRLPRTAPEPDGEAALECGLPLAG